jgi:hypothetical protein
MGCMATRCMECKCMGNHYRLVELDLDLDLEWLVLNHRHQFQVWVEPEL